MIPMVKSIVRANNKKIVQFIKLTCEAIIMVNVILYKNHPIISLSDLPAKAVV